MTVACRGDGAAGVKRIAIDSMIVDKIMGTPGVLASVQTAGTAGALVIIGSHIIRDQLEATRDPDRRRHLLSTYDALPLKSVPTRGAVWDITPWGAGRWGDGAETGISIGEARTPGKGWRGLKDALIATTASGEADVLVTEDSNLAKRARNRCEVWSFAQFEAFVRSAV